MRYRHSAFFYSVLQPLLHLLWLVPSYYLRVVQPDLKPRTRVIICTDSHILLIKNVVGSKQWTLPGGGRHRNETADACAKREVKEELGIDLAVLRSVGKSSEISKGAKWNYDCFVSRLDAMPQIHLSIELSEAKWFPLSALPVSIRPYAAELIKQIELPELGTK
jgi:8-oxo-dGTP pyrophosphatase MutT (NUDIX family)